MTNDELKWAILYLQNQDYPASSGDRATRLGGVNGKEVELPYGVFPGQYPGGEQHQFHNKADWDAYEWNPPQYFQNVEGFSEADPDASARPEWERLVEVIDEGWLLDNVPTIQSSVHRERMKRLRNLFNVTSDLDLLLFRQENAIGSSDQQSQSQLITSDTAIQSWVGNSQRTRQTLENLDVTDDALWLQDWRPPNIVYEATVTPGTSEDIVGYRSGSYGSLSVSDEDAEIGVVYAIYQSSIADTDYLFLELSGSPDNDDDVFEELRLPMLALSRASAHSTTQSSPARRQWRWVLASSMFTSGTTARLTFHRG